VKATTCAISAESGESGPRPQCNTHGASSARASSEANDCCSQGRAACSASPKNEASPCMPRRQASINTSQVQLLDAFPLSRARTVAEASERIGRTFSPHRLELRGCGDARALDVHHNQVRMRSVTINTLRYGTDVFIDPGERGDFYMVQLPLSGKSLLLNGRDETGLDPEVLSVLQPRARCRMLWGRDCSMILVQVPADALEVAFKRGGELYARKQRMTSVHRALHAAAREGRGVSITDIAMAHGFMHLSRFASQYREQVGCAPSETLRLH
jgi:AraC-like DNA-binding protein